MRLPIAIAHTFIILQTEVQYDNILLQLSSQHFLAISSKANQLEQKLDRKSRKFLQMQKPKNKHFNNYCLIREHSPPLFFSNL